MARQSGNPRRRNTGRVTPKGGAAPGSPNGKRPGMGRRGRSRLGADEPAQVGKRPSNPAFLLVLGLAWIGCGIVAVVALKASWRLIPGIFFIGVGLFFIRAAATTVLRRGGPDGG